MDQFGTLVIHQHILTLTFAPNNYSHNWVPTHKQTTLKKIHNLSMEEAQKIVDNFMQALTPTLRNDVSFQFIPEPISMIEIPLNLLNRE